MNKIIGKLVRSYFQIMAGSSAPVFIHIPKTGGTFIGQFESFRSPVLWPVKHLGHCAVSDKALKDHNYPPLGYSARKIVLWKSLEKRFVFSSCRNIFDWLVSYAGHAGGWGGRYRDVNHYDYQISQKGFDYLVKTLANRDDPWPSRKMIHFPMFAEGGRLVVDWICRTETLEQDLIDLASYRECSFRGGEKQRVGERGDYRNYYSDQLIDLVYETWGSELALFGYEFDGYKPPLAFLPRLIEPTICDRIKYVWKTDTLTIDGQIIPKNVRNINDFLMAVAMQKSQA